MEQPNTGNKYADGGYFILLAVGSWISGKDIVTFITAVGGFLYMLNQLRTLIKDIRNKKDK
ncbi:hypothetical protein CAP35_13725 [Chitinophagaceae bacterium IBVUCB1]|nr:hypothetical protein CAP35_13725 [Chitinophagaceae bacterium IBVUCB1]